MSIDEDGVEAAASALAFPELGGPPAVSIVVPVYNHVRYTIECLTSILRHTDPVRTPYEVILADDASTDATASFLDGVPNLRIARLATNTGFLLNCNNAAHLARGRTILLLNNDVQVTQGWLDAMLTLLDSSPEIGAVGPLIIYPAGHVQEAGTRIRADATADMIGLNRPRDEPRFRSAGPSIIAPVPAC